MSILRMLVARHRAFQFRVFIPSLITAIQLSFDRVDFLLLIRFAFAFVVNEYRATVPILALRNLTIEIKPLLLELRGGPLSVGRVLGRMIGGSSPRA